MKPKSQEPSSQTDLFNTRLLIFSIMVMNWHYWQRWLTGTHWLQNLVSFLNPFKDAPALPARLVAGLHYLKHAYELPDESVIESWIENPYWQLFFGAGHNIRLILRTLRIFWPEFWRLLRLLWAPTDKIQVILAWAASDWTKKRVFQGRLIRACSDSLSFW